MKQIEVRGDCVHNLKNIDVSFLRSKSTRFLRSIRIIATTEWIAYALRLSRTASTSAGERCTA